MVDPCLGLLVLPVRDWTWTGLSLPTHPRSQVATHGSTAFRGWLHFSVRTQASRGLSWPFTVGNMPAPAPLVMQLSVPVSTLLPPARLAPG